MKTHHSFFMQLAINEAWKYQLLTYPNPAVGACVVKNNEVLAVDAHYKAGLPHAEVNALKKAFLSIYPDSDLKKLTSSHDIHEFLYENHNNFFHDCAIYVTLEPCNHSGKTPACAKLLEAIGIKKIVIGSMDPNNEASGGYQRLVKQNFKVSTSCLDEKTNDLLLPFTKWQKDQFIFFKLAMREDGSIDGGYITTKQSLTKVHQIRELIDTIIIGGNTVRTDRPTLDTRFVKNSKKDPNILIYSKQKEFDQTIPLFNVKNRKITISNSFESIQNDKFLMIEGGYQLLAILKDKIDLLMVFVSPQNPTNHKFNLEELGFKIIHEDDSNEDKIVWLKPQKGI
jgi:diaminohydroxyphosphoribosylaminopyrimidine deaminase/5-amino-6-(5-phosphoribosylamino)uracil reductase